jgi:hypothetical protein
MNSRSQNGAMNVAGLVAVLMTVLFIGAAVFGAMAFSGKQDYKNNTDKKIDIAVTAAVKSAQVKKDADFAEAQKSPVKSYQGSSTFGTVYFEYPKTYSGYVISNSSYPIDGMFYPGVVPGSDDSVAFALRVQVLNTSYDSLVRQFDSDIKTGKVTALAFRAAKVPDVLGTRIDGEISSKKQGTIVLLPLRDKTLKIWTESKEFTAEFDKYVLPSLSFVP